MGPRGPAITALAFGLTLLYLPCVTSADQAKLDDEPEVAEEQVKQEAVLEAKYEQMKLSYGIQDRRTLEVFFQLFDLWIMLYRLNKADAALQEIVPACEWRRDDLTIKAVQAVAFTRWKQGRHREALASFHLMEGWMGKNAPLCENIGHTYNQLGSHARAEHYFQQALKFARNEPKSNEGGVLLGLANVRERLGDLKEALPAAQEAYEYFRRRDEERGWGSSLTAKAAMHLSKVQLRLGHLEEAEKGAREALQLFEGTAGVDSPLVVGALKRIGTVQVQRGQLLLARESFHRAYEVEGMKDSLDLVEIMEIHSHLVDAQIKADIVDKQAFRKYLPTVKRVLQRVRHEMKQDGNAGAYYKVAGEMYVLAGSCNVGKPLLLQAMQLFRGEAVETDTLKMSPLDTSGLVKQCTELVSYCDGKLPGQDKQATAGQDKHPPGPTTKHARFEL